MRGREDLHVLEGIGGVGVGVVRHDGDRVDAVLRQLGRNSREPILHCFPVWAVVADEYYECPLVAARRQAYSAAHRRPRVRNSARSSRIREWRAWPPCCKPLSRWPHLKCHGGRGAHSENLPCLRDTSIAIQCWHWGHPYRARNLNPTTTLSWSRRIYYYIVRLAHGRISWKSLPKKWQGGAKGR